MKRISTLLLILFTCLVAFPLRLTAQPQYTVTDLGTVGGTFSLAGGLSNSGWVEGYSTTTGDVAYRGFLWRKGVMTDLGTLGGPNSEAGWRPGNTGNAAGNTETGAVDPYAEDFCGFGDNLICLPYFWRSSTKQMTALPTLGGNNGSAAGINNQGVVAGLSENTTPAPFCAGTTQYFQWKPVLWIGGKIHELPTFPGDQVGGAFSINDRGQATGRSRFCDGGSHPLLWQNGKAIYLGTLGGTEGEGLDINNLGQVTGWSNLPGVNSYDAFLWQNGVMTDLGVLPGDVSSVGEGINKLGQVVGGSFDADGNPRPFLWQNGVMVDLNTLIPPDSPLYLLEPTGTINDSGQIAGYAYVFATGEIHAFLATPTGTEVPAGATREVIPRPKVTLPDNVRKLLQRRGRFGGLKGGPVRPQ